jgi:hypothetical protein
MKPSANETSMRLRVLSLPFIAANLLKSNASEFCAIFQRLCVVRRHEWQELLFHQPGTMSGVNSGVAFLCAADPAYRPASSGEVGFCSGRDRRSTCRVCPWNA